MNERAAYAGPRPCDSDRRRGPAVSAAERPTRALQLNQGPLARRAESVRITETRFGSFETLVGAAVYANGWWIRAAGGVVLDGTPVWRKLSDCQSTVEGLVRATDPDYGMPSWIERLGPQALQCSASVFSSPLFLGLVACRVDGERDIAYPFLLRGDSHTECGFSSSGPSQDLQVDIALAVAFQFLNTSRIQRGAARATDAG